MAPWQYTTNTEAAMNSLVAVATGKKCLPASLMVSYIADQLMTAADSLFNTPVGCVFLLLGGDFEPALLQQPFGISRTDAVSFILKGFQAALTGNRLLAA